MGCDESFITIKLIWHGYLVLNLNICAHEIFAEAGLSGRSLWHEKRTSIWVKRKIRFISHKKNSKKRLVHNGRSNLGFDKATFCNKVLTTL